MADTTTSQKRKKVDSDSDDDVPLSELRNKIAIKEEPKPNNLIGKKNGVIKKSSSSSSPSTIKQEPTKNATLKAAAATKDDDSDDSDDDVPIAVLMKRKQEAALAAKKTASASASASASPAKKAKIVSKPTSSSSSSSSSVKKSSTPIKKKAVASSTKSSSSSSSGGSAKKLKGDPFESSELTEKFYSTLDKGKLCQRLLRRWWYALSWPQEGVMDLCPKGYEPLNGYPGVFVGTTTNFIGNIVDKRDPDTCPNLRNFSQKSSDELKDLCIVAYEEQIRQLVQAEGENTKLERILKKELAEIKHIKPEKADKQAEKLLKQPF